MLAYIIIAVAAYFLGSIPTGYLAAQAKGIDIRTVGSGNIGATNAMRVLGKPAGIAVLLMDAFKGYAACAFLPPLIYNRLAPHLSGLAVYFHDEPVELQTRFHVLAGIFAVLGHNYTCWLKFKGGKGIATTGGVYLALAPVAVGVALAALPAGGGADAICFDRFHHRGGGCLAGGRLVPAEQQFVPRHRDHGVGGHGHLQTQIQHQTAHGRNRKPARPET